MTPPPPNARSAEEKATTKPRRPLTQEVGEGFMFGSLLGSAYHFPKGGFRAVRTKASRVGAYWAVSWAAYSAIEYAMVSKEEPVLNSAVAAAGACAITNLHLGVRTAAVVALVGGACGSAFPAAMLTFKEGGRRSPEALAGTTGG